MDLHLDVFDGNLDALNSENVARHLLEDVITSLEMQALVAPSALTYDGGTKPNEGGVTAFAVITESHVACHTWPKRRFAQVNVSSCRAFDVDPVVKIVQAVYGGHVEKHLLSCGLDFARSRGMAGVVPDEEKTDA